MPTARLSLLTPGLTAGARRGLVGADEPLDESGARDAERITLPRNGFRDVRLLTGPETQCRQTAAAAAGLLSVTPQVTADLRDWDLGTWSGRLVEEVAASDPAAYAAWVADPDASPAGGESLSALVERAQRWLPTLDGTVVAVGCTPVVRAVVVAALSLPLPTFWSLDVEPAARVDLTIRGRRAALRWRGPAS